MARRDRNEAPMSFFSFQDIVSCVMGIMVMVSMLLALELVGRRAGSGGEVVGAVSDDKLEQAVIDLRKQRDELQRLINEGKVTLVKMSGGAVVTEEQLKALAEKVVRLEGNLPAVSDQIARGEKPTADAMSLIEQLRKDIDQRTQELARTEAQAQPLAKLPALPVPPRAPRAAGGAEKTPIYVECDAARLTAGTITAERGGQVLKRFDGAGARQALLQWIAQRSPATEYVVLLVRPEGVTHFRPIVAELESRGFEVGWGVCVPEYRPFAATTVLE